MSVFQIIITYNPDCSKLRLNIESSINQVDGIIIVDNDSSNINILEKLASTYTKIQIIKLEKNRGIAYATNVAIIEAQKHRCDYFLLSDQDSMYPEKYIKTAIEILKKEELIFAVTPIIYDKTTNSRKPVFILKHGFIKKTQLHGQTEVFQTIASGLLVKLKLVDTSLMQNESLFIDYVDYEWCWNAIIHGYKIVADDRLVINHELGDKSGRIAGKNISIRNVKRYYYIIRNTIFLSLYCKYLNFRVRMQLFFKSIEYLLGYTFISKGYRGNTFLYLIKAFRDGVRKKLGECI